MSENRFSSAIRRGAMTDDGYTLIEMLVVVAIIALLVGLIGPRVLSYLGESKIKAATIQIDSLKSAVELFYLDTGKYPSSSQGLSALVARPSDGTGWNGPYLKGDRVPLDPWGHSFVYTLPGAHDAFDIKTLGPDVR